MANENQDVPRTEQQAPRFTIQLYRLDNSLDNPVKDAYSIGCFDEKQAQFLYETLQRLLQMITYKPFNQNDI